MGVNRLCLVGARPFVERQEIIHAKRGGIGGGVEEGIGGLGQAHEAAGFFVPTDRDRPFGRLGQGEEAGGSVAVTHCRPG